MRAFSCFSDVSTSAFAKERVLKPHFDWDSNYVNHVTTMYFDVVELCYERPRFCWLKPHFVGGNFRGISSAVGDRIGAAVAAVGVGGSGQCGHAKQESHGQGAPLWGEHSEAELSMA